MLFLALLCSRKRGETIRAGVNLSADEYAKADPTHMTEGAYVQGSDRLQPGRQPRQMAGISGFERIFPI